MHGHGVNPGSPVGACADLNEVLVDNVKELVVDTRPQLIVTRDQVEAFKALKYAETGAMAPDHRQLL